MSFNKRFIVFLVFLLGLSFLVLSLPQDSNAAPIPPPESNCCLDHEETGCDNSECEALVCVVDDFCCDIEWDSNCVGIAVEFCDNLCQAPPGSNCCFPHFDEPGCNDSACEAVVCGIDEFCCDPVWDAICVGIAIQECGDLCPAPPGSDCCYQNGFSGCSDSLCENTICTIEPFCCDVEWDGECVDLAEDLCGICGTEESCCIEHAGPGCNVETCEDFICTIDPFCCNVGWDDQCVEEAEQFCDACGGSPATTIPTLNQWSLIALAGMLGLAALYIIIRRNPLKTN